MLVNYDNFHFDVNYPFKVQSHLLLFSEFSWLSPVITTVSGTLHEGKKSFHLDFARVQIGHSNLLLGLKMTSFCRNFAIVNIQ